MARPRLVNRHNEPPDDLLVEFIERRRLENARRQIKSYRLMIAGLSVACVLLAAASLVPWLRQVDGTAVAVTPAVVLPTVVTSPPSSASPAPRPLPDTPRPAARRSGAPVPSPLAPPPAEVADGSGGKPPASAGVAPASTGSADTPEPVATAAAPVPARAVLATQDVEPHPVATRPQGSTPPPIGSPGPSPARPGRPADRLQRAAAWLGDAYEKVIDAVRTEQRRNPGVAPQPEAGPARAAEAP